MKRKISFFLAILFVLTIGIVKIPGKQVNAAEGTVIDTVASKLNKIYSCIDPADITYVNNAKDKIALLPSDDAEWDTILDSSILNTTVKTSLGGDVLAKAALIKFIKELASITYNGDLAALKTSLTNFKTSNLETYRSLFGIDTTMDDFYQLFINAEAAFPSVIAGNTAWRDTLAHGAYADLIAIVPDVVKEAIIQGMTPTLVDKLSSVGWSMDLLKTKLVSLINYADTANKDAQISIAKAIVRSEATLTVDPVGTNANVDNTTIDGSQTSLISYTLSIMGNDATGLVKWYSSNPSVAAFNQGAYGESQLAPLSNGSTTITVYRQGATGVTTTPEADWIVKAFTLNVTGLQSAVDNTALSNLIATAQQKYDTSIEGDYPGKYQTGSRLALNNALSLAKGVNTNPAATQLEVDNALADLQTAINQFDAAKITATTIDVIMKDTLAVLPYQGVTMYNWTLRRATTTSGVDFYTNTTRIVQENADGTFIDIPKATMYPNTTDYDKNKIYLKCYPDNGVVNATTGKFTFVNNKANGYKTLWLENGNGKYSWYFLISGAWYSVNIDVMNKEIQNINGTAYTYVAPTILGDASGDGLAGQIGDIGMFKNIFKGNGPSMYPTTYLKMIKAGDLDGNGSLSIGETGKLINFFKGRSLVISNVTN